jgi:tripeptidyl-peptidase-1
VQGGATQSVAGTSCSSPTFTGILAMVIEQRLRAGKGSLGYLNPWIYSNAGKLLPFKRFVLFVFLFIKA